MLHWAIGQLAAGEGGLALLAGKATVLLALAWAGHAALSRCNPRWRVGLWRSMTVGLVAICSLAIAPPIIGWRLERSQPPSRLSDVHQRSIDIPGRIALRGEVGRDADRSSARADVEPSARREPRPGERDAPASDPRAVAPRAVAVPAVAPEGRYPTAASLWPWLLLVWMAGTVILMARAVMSAWSLSCLLRRSKDAPDLVNNECRAIATSLGIARDVRVLLSVEVLSPCLTGLRSPAVLLPDRQCNDAERAELRAILAHELAHVRAHDLVWNAAMHVLSLLLWFHPLIWRARAAHAAACDSVCDSVAADLIGDVTVYCRTLARLALLVSGRPAHGLAMARTSDVSRRIQSLHRKVFRALPTEAAMPARIAVGFLIVLIGGLGFIRADEAATPEAQEAGVSQPGAASSPLDALDRAQIDRDELSVASAGDPALTLPSLVAILGNSRLKMHWHVQALAFTPDGRSLIGAGDRVIRLWDPVTGAQQRVLRGHTDHVTALALSPDGGTLVSGSHDLTVKVWDLVAGKERLTLKGHLGSLSSVAVSADGTRIASGDHWSSIRLWDGSDGRQLMVHEDHGKSVNALAFSPDGKTLAAGGDGGVIRLCDSASGRIVKTLERPGERWRALAFSPDGKTLAAGGYDHGLVLWDTITWSVRLHVPEVDRHGVDALAFTRDGRRLALNLGYAARMIDTQTGELVRQFPKQSIGINALALGRDDATLATTGTMITLWDVASGRETTPELPGHRGNIDSLAFSPDGGQLATASLDGTVKLWGIADRKERLTLRAYDHSARAVAFRPDGKALASLGFAPELILWELPSGKKLQTFTGDGDVAMKVLFSPDGRSVAAGALNRLRAGSLTLWDLETGGLRSTLSAGVWICAFTPDSKRIIFAGNDGVSQRKPRVVVWNIAEKKIEQTTSDGDMPSRLDVGAVSPDGRVLALSGMSDEKGKQRKAVVILWGLAEGRVVYQLEFAEEQGATHLSFSKDARTLLGVGRDGLGRVWDPRNGTLRETIQVAEAGREFVIRDIAFAPDGRHFAAALGNGTARIFRIKPAPPAAEPRPPVVVERKKPEPPGELWKRLVGKPAPELQKIKAWDGGTPVTMADLRGRFVLLQFWNEQSPFRLGSLISVHDQFADQGKGLVIIVVGRNARDSAAGFGGWKGILAHAPAGNHAVPFRLALDGGGVTAIEGTDAVAYGATHAAFGVHSAVDWTSWPVNILIGPDGTVLKAGPGVATRVRDLETALGVQAKVPAWLKRFDELYALKPGQVLKRVGPPFPIEREDFSFFNSAALLSDSSHTYIFHFDGNLRLSGTNFRGHLRDDVLVFALGFRRADFEGPRELLGMKVPGDWIIRSGASKTDLLKAVEAIMRDELKTPVTFTEREVERDALIVKGRYRFHPLGDVPGATAIHLGTDSLPSSDGGGGSGTQKKMFEWLGNHTGVMVVDESESAGDAKQLVWRDHLREQPAETQGGVTLDRVLENLTKQTQLTFQRGRRAVKVWSVSRAQ
jgi:WD40 repeat protein/beta-lactamase regulating signal transducer with metallopeptidase domain